jgi:hypothetical protein
VRSRSGAAPPPTPDGSAVPSTVPAGSRTPTQPVVGFSMRSPLPSPIRGLLQTHRRKPSHTSSASSLFAAAQWKPGVASAGTSCASGSGSVGASPQCSGCVSSSCGVSKGMDCMTLIGACSMGPNMGAGLCSEGSSTAHGQAESQAGCRHAAAALVAAGAHAKQPLAYGCAGAGGSGELRSAAGQKQQLARYPSAPDPGLLLALPPACTIAKGMPPPVPVSLERSGSSGMRGMWLKVRCMFAIILGLCRTVACTCRHTVCDGCMSTCQSLQCRVCLPAASVRVSCCCATAHACVICMDAGAGARGVQVGVQARSTGPCDPGRGRPLCGVSQPLRFPAYKVTTQSMHVCSDGAAVQLMPP